MSRNMGKRTDIRQRFLCPVKHFDKGEFLRPPGALFPAGHLVLIALMKSLRNGLVTVFICVARFSAAAESVADGQALTGTQPLALQGDIASNLVAGVDRFLLQELDRSESRREQYWHRDFSSPEAYQASIATNRARLI